MEKAAAKTVLTGYVLRVSRALATRYVALIFKSASFFFIQFNFAPFVSNAHTHTCFIYFICSATMVVNPLMAVVKGYKYNRLFTDGMKGSIRRLKTLQGQHLPPKFFYLTGRFFFFLTILRNIDSGKEKKQKKTKKRLQSIHRLVLFSYFQSIRYVKWVG